jgi:hypothetical protein
MSNATPAYVPLPLALLLCDACYVEPGSQKKALIGLFDALSAPSFPYTHPQLIAYLAVTDTQGRVPFRFRIVDVDEDRGPVVDEALEAEVADRAGVVELLWCLRGVRFPAPGEYRAQVFAGAAPLLERRLMLVRAQPPPSREG